ncbi:MAG: carboxyl transferase domain-containing protein [Saprospiraceae bacterium]
MAKKKDNLNPYVRELQERQKYLQNVSRSEAVNKRHANGGRTARENVDDLVDDGSFLEYGSLTVAAQRGRRTMEDLIKNTPADGLIAGIGSINGQYFTPSESQCAVLAYDYTVLAGTQGAFNHKKTDRLLQIVKETNLPIVFFVEGGGGRPGDVDMELVYLGGLDIKTFSGYARLNGQVPRIAIVSGYCFAGNAAIAGCSDVIIATENISLGMGGPAMIEGGGLGRYHPREIGPASVHLSTGVIDILVKNEKAAVAVAQKYISYFQGELSDWNCVDKINLRNLIPENRKYSYDIRKVIHALCDKDSVLELRESFGKNMFTGLVRIEGKPFGLMGNDSRYLGGAIDSDASDKAARFMQLCDAFELPIISLCDAPGFMVGPEHEKTGLVRHTARMFLVGAAINVPLFCVVLRKAYGLGAMAMAGGGFHDSIFTVSWPTGEFGAMGLEGAVKLGFSKELGAVKNIKDKQELYQSLVAKSYEKGKAIHAARFLEFDEVIDPKDTRKWIMKGYVVTRKKKKRTRKKFIDAF